MPAANSLSQRVLALDAVSRGFGFVVFEGPERLIDWGTFAVHQDRQHRSLELVRALLERYTPDVLVFENYRSRSSRRCRYVRQLLRAVAALASAQAVSTRALAPRTVRKVFARLGARNKDQTAAILAARFPGLDPSVPPARQPWMNESSRLAIFDAAAFALTHLEHGTDIACKPKGPTDTSHA